MYHLTEFLYINEKNISNNCSNVIYNVDSRNEKTDLFHKIYSSK